METIELDEALLTLPKIIERLSKESTKVKVTAPEGSVVLLSEETYENLLVTLEFLSAPGLLDSFRDNLPQEEIFPKELFPKELFSNDLFSKVDAE